MSVDSTVVRAPQHAAGAPHEATQRADSNYKNPRVSEPDDHALGRPAARSPPRFMPLPTPTPALCPIAYPFAVRDNADCCRRSMAVPVPRTATTRPRRPAPRRRASRIRRRGPRCVAARSCTPSRARRPDRASQGQRLGRRSPASIRYCDLQAAQHLRTRLQPAQAWRGIATRYDKYALTFLGRPSHIDPRSRTPIQSGRHALVVRLQHPTARRVACPPSSDNQRLLPRIDALSLQDGQLAHPSTTPSRPAGSARGRDCIQGCAPAKITTLGAI